MLLVLLFSKEIVLNKLLDENLFLLVKISNNLSNAYLKAQNFAILVS